ncbi:hypothetical protein G7B40_004275 [Aetokthonos hydrillicola Thurmond2011]|jgi:hypothetical protein|uniref:SPOR domain-containing protein n=1 Tax=Aetokthonos hydrillicola Thurmond2011 TaxID=2712845 RepID=A0AAP5I7B4_9CYAN|nr:hypothetical protein [Aetokthonos hydrillicola]MBO3457497.1 hypothetical protein [Aetokthonos hydrillicola CCALA 1050]MBW4585980.1 hypothetical protein [Aetokthonos hydrillicola CCALA 1050]MDR9893790.1 hypothetical protein [Aetokthonos hydrillicola Thurmond2011]
MYKTAVKRFLTLSNGLVLASIGLIGGINSVAAQQQISACQPPSPGEYLLLVVSPTPDNQSQLRRALPPELKILTCKYLKDTVTRIGGFTKIEDANRWARYINNVVGLTGIITTRPKDTIATSQPASNHTASRQPASYKPQKLGQGFAVLVNYYNRPEVANQVQQIVGGDVGFVSYAQHPYLLAVYTTNQKEAYNTLQNLTNHGLFPILVDSQKVILLRSVVHLQ